MESKFIVTLDFAKHTETHQHLKCGWKKNILMLYMNLDSGKQNGRTGAKNKMLRFSVIHQMPNGDTFNFSNHKTKELAEKRIERLTNEYRRHPEKFETWLDPSLLKVRDNVKNHWRIP